MATKLAALARVGIPHAPRKLSKPHIKLKLNGTWEVYTFWNIEEDLKGDKYTRLIRNALRNYKLLQQTAWSKLGAGYKTTWDVYYEAPRGTLLIIKSVWSPKL